MSTVALSFSHVFEKIDLPDNILKKFREAKVNSIEIDKKLKTLLIEMQLLEVVSSNYINSLKKELSKTFPSISDININLNYNLENITVNEKISMFWDNILCMIKEKSALCYTIMEDCKWELIKNNLIIYVKNNTSFIFIKKGLDKIIQEFTEKNIDKSIRISFKDIVIKDEEKLEYENRLIEKESQLVNDVVIESLNLSLDNNNSEKIEPKKQIKDKTEFFKATKGISRSNIKINKDLIKELDNNAIMLSESIESGVEMIVSGKIFDIELRETKSQKYLITFDMTDGKNSITIKFFIKPENYTDDFKNLIKKNSNVIVKGKVQDDEYAKELNIMAQEICEAPKSIAKMDNAEEKRVELHLHTKMSSMDGIETAKAYIQKAIEWGHSAIAITDHGVVQAFPEAMEVARGKDIKILYGVEAYLIDDLGAVVESARNQTFDDTFVVFDLETTGLQKETDKIIEIGAVKILKGEIIDRFSTFINPKTKLSPKIIELTSINDSMLVGAPLINEILPSFIEFIGDSVLVAHNASFDVGFVREALKNSDVELDNTVLDTVELSRTLLPELSRHKLDVVAKHLEISLENHHRAVDDAEATAKIFLKFIEMLISQNITRLDEINILASEKINKNKLKTYHAIVLVKNYVGLRNLYELISKSHIEYFYRKPRIPKSEFLKFREGLIIGTACEAGEFFKAVKDKKPKEFIRELAEFYDYFEIQPIDNNMYMLRDGKVGSVQELININKEIVRLGEQYNKPVVATCDVHFMNQEDEIFRRIIMYNQGFKDADIQAPLYFRTTEEMLLEFEYLGKEKAYEVVVHNTNLIANMIENIKPIPDETFPPKIEGSDEEIKNICIEKAKSIYGEKLPKIVEERLDRELDSIIKNGFSVMYIIAQKLVWKSMEDGYLVGSRGSVGSSFVATMSGITEVNPLQPHYVCSSCKYSDFESETVLSYLGSSGCDMPDMLCPVCKTQLSKDGHDIPFETFLGFDGDKEPDIDLNFSGEYQSRAHAYTVELFGEENVFKAGTIGTIAEKTAFGFVKKYADENGIGIRNAEVKRLRNGCTGIKRTTGQHPGGLMVVPNGNSIYEFCPIQRPANDQKSTVTTTHFDYHSISGRLLKLDLLGHDVPTIIRYLHDTTGVDPQTVSLGDKKVISLFTSPEALGVTAEEINCKTGSLGLPEFGTSFVRQMLLDTRPSTFAELVRISGLSHGTDVWFNNAQELIKDGVATLKDVIPTRDDIMVYLINKGVEKKASFKIMENVRKGKGLTKDEVDLMKASDVPDWYIESCRRIKYMFPKGHAVAYVMMTVRIGYFKIYFPYSFYGAIFSVKAEDFDYELMCCGVNVVKAEMQRISSLGKDASTKEKCTLTILELVLEMYARGLKFLPLDLYKAQSTKFIVTKEGLMPPLSSIQGLGSNAAQGIVSAREDGEFLTVEEFRERTKTTKTVIELLKKNNILKGIPDTDQLSLF